MSDYQFIAKSEEIEEGKGRPYPIGDKRIALIRHEGTIHAIDDQCPHADASLAFGPIKDGCIICPWHYAAFDLATGEALSGPVVEGVNTYEVKEENGEIFIKISLSTS